MSEIATNFALARHHRLRLLSGDYNPIFFKGAQPPKGCEKGATYVLSWARSSRTLAEDVVLELPRRPLRWLTVSDVRRHPKATGWMIRFNVEDFRDPELYMARGPGVNGSNYTTSTWGAVEAVKVVDPVFQARLSKDAYDRDHAMRMEARIAERQRWRRTKLAAKREMQAFPSRFPTAA